MLRVCTFFYLLVLCPNVPIDGLIIVMAAEPGAMVVPIVAGVSVLSAVVFAALSYWVFCVLVNAPRGAALFATHAIQISAQGATFAGALHTYLTVEPVHQATWVAWVVASLSALIAAFLLILLLPALHEQDF